MKYDLCVVLVLRGKRMLSVTFSVYIVCGVDIDQLQFIIEFCFIYFYKRYDQFSFFYLSAQVSLFFILNKRLTVLGDIPCQSISYTIQLIFLFLSLLGLTRYEQIYYL